VSRDWTPKELRAASETMKAAGHMSYEEFCEQFPRMMVVENAPSGAGNELQRPVLPGDR